MRGGWEKGGGSKENREGRGGERDRREEGEEGEKRDLINERRLVRREGREER